MATMLHVNKPCDRVVQMELSDVYMNFGNANGQEIEVGSADPLN